MINLEDIKKTKGYTYTCKETKYLLFLICKQPDRKTPIVTIRTLDGEIVLGEIRFYGAWRKFVFYPKEETLFDSKCLCDIINMINTLQESWKNKEFN